MSGVVVIRISRPRRHDLELQLPWDHQSQPQICPPPPRRCKRDRLSPAMLRVMPPLVVLWVIVPYPTDLTNATVAAISHHDDGDSEHYRSSILLLAYPHPTVHEYI